MPTFGVEHAPDGGLRVFVDVSEHECRVAGVDPNAQPDAAPPENVAERVADERAAATPPAA